MRILLVSMGFPPYGPGGANVTSMYKDADALHKGGHRVTVVCGWSKRGTVIETPSYLIRRMHFMDMPPRFVWFQIQNQREILELAAQSDIVYSYSFDLAFLTGAIKKNGTSVVTRVGGSPLSNVWALRRLPTRDIGLGEAGYFLGELPLLVKATRNVLVFADHLIFDARHTMIDLSRQFHIDLNNKSTILPNATRSSAIGMSEGFTLSKTILFSGRLIATKGLLDLVRAFERLVIQGHADGWSLLIVGDGPLRRRLDGLASGNLLKGRVTLTGRLPIDEALAKCQISSIFVLPSYSESSSDALAEAMQLGLPVVVPDQSWAQEECANYANKKVFRLGDVDDLAEKLLSTMTEDRKRTPNRAPDAQPTISDVLGEIAHYPLGESETL